MIFQTTATIIGKKALQEGQLASLYISTLGSGAAEKLQAGGLKRADFGGSV